MASYIAFGLYLTLYLGFTWSDIWMARRRGAASVVPMFMTGVGTGIRGTTFFIAFQLIVLIKSSLQVRNPEDKLWALKIIMGQSPAYGDWSPEKYMAVGFFILTLSSHILIRAALWRVFSKKYKKAFDISPKAFIKATGSLTKAEGLPLNSMRDLGYEQVNGEWVKTAISEKGADDAHSG